MQWHQQANKTHYSLLGVGITYNHLTALLSFFYLAIFATSTNQSELCLHIVSIFKSRNYVLTIMTKGPPSRTVTFIRWRFNCRVQSERWCTNQHLVPTCIASSGTWRKIRGELVTGSFYERLVSVHSFAYFNNFPRAVSANETTHCRIPLHH